MQKKCRECFRICKWLESSDEPKRYSFDFLKQDQILSVVERRFREHDFAVLLLENLAESNGNQLAVSFVLRNCEPAEDTGFDETITLIAQCEPREKGTDMILRFGVEDSLCANSAAVDEFHTLLNDILESLAASDFLMSACPAEDLNCDSRGGE